MAIGACRLSRTNGTTAPTAASAAASAVATANAQSGSRSPADVRRHGVSLTREL